MNEQEENTNKQIISIQFNNTGKMDEKISSMDKDIVNTKENFSK